MPPKIVYGAKKTDLAEPGYAQEDRSGTEPQKPGTVQIIARVRTEKGTHDIVLPESITEDKELHNMLLKYASWKEKMGEKTNSIDFETWRHIYTW